MGTKFNNTNNRAILPGSFNPLHNGHEGLIRLAALDYEKVFVVVAVNDNKKYMVTLNQRFNVVKKFVDFSDLRNVEVLKLEPGKTIPELAFELDVENIVRGTKHQTVPLDESQLADYYLEYNKKLNFHYVSFADLNVTSSQVRDLIAHKESIEGLVPESVRADIEQLWKVGN